MAAPKEKKPKQIEIDISTDPGCKTVYANAYSLERENEHVIFYFSFQSDQTGVSTKIAAVSVGIADILNQVKNWESYLVQTAPLVESLGPYKKPIRGIFSVEMVEAASVVQMSRMGALAEISFAIFVLHELVLYKEGQTKLVAERKLLVRCSLHMQVDLLFKIIELVREDLTEEAP